MEDEHPASSVTSDAARRLLELKKKILSGGLARSPASALSPLPAPAPRPLTKTASPLAASVPLISHAEKPKEKKAPLTLKSLMSNRLKKKDSEEGVSKPFVSRLKEAPAHRAKVEQVETKVIRLTKEEAVVHTHESSQDHISEEPISSADESMPTPIDPSSQASPLAASPPTLSSSPPASVAEVIAKFEVNPPPALVPKRPKIEETTSSKKQRMSDQLEEVGEVVANVDQFVKNKRDWLKEHSDCPSAPLVAQPKTPAEIDLFIQHHKKFLSAKSFLG